MHAPSIPSVAAVAAVATPRVSADILYPTAQEGAVGDTAARPREAAAPTPTLSLATRGGPVASKATSTTTVVGTDAGDAIGRLPRALAGDETLNASLLRIRELLNVVPGAGLPPDLFSPLRNAGMHSSETPQTTG